MEKRERYSLRKYKVGAVSVLLGAVFLAGGPHQALANETTQETGVRSLDAGEVGLLEEDLSHVADLEVASDRPKSVSVGATDEPLAKEGTVRPQSLDSNELLTVPTVWEAGYKGEGTVVAIIDSGIDVNHDVLRITDSSKAKFQSAEQIEAAKQAAGIDYGQWYNDKVVYGYNYVDVNTVLKEADKTSHGMHVTSIAAGNPSLPKGGELVAGVAPEAQVMFLRVFSDVAATTGPGLYVRAIEDAVKLGADSINLSLGGANGSVVNMDDTMVAAIERAKKAGVSVIIAAGNDGTFGNGHSNPSAENPDYGLVSSPSTTLGAISVASYNNSSIMSEVVSILGMEDDATLNHGKTFFTNTEKSEVPFEIGKAYDYVYVGLGKPEDFEGKDLEGKLALIQRGEITFSNKIANATAAGAIGAVVFNNKEKEPNFTMSLDETAAEIPSIFIPKEFGEALTKQTYQIQFNQDVVKQDNANAGMLSDFSSWGLTADGQLKPDLAAPGGSIYAAINDNAYGSMNGTSMAAPHVAGAAVLLKQHLVATYPTKSPQEIEALVKHLLMSTAKPHYNQKTSAYTSPRQQGAGLVDTAAALASTAYLTGADGYGSISLGNVTDTVDLAVTLHNLSNQDKTYTYTTYLTTDGVKNGLFTLTPRALKEESGKTVTVKANSQLTVPISLDASAFAAELSQEMPNGYFLEGFVRFVNAEKDTDVLSIPYVGFRGAFQNLPVVEEPIYNLIADGRGGFYFEPLEDQDRLGLEDSQHYTGLVTSSSEVLYATGSRSDMALKALGTFKNKEGRFVLELDKEGKPYLAISPNGDDNQDSLAFKGVFLRNYTDLVATVYEAADTERQRPLWTSQPEGGDKNYFSGNPDSPKSTTVFPTEWNGTDQDGKDLPDGRYQYVLTYSPEIPGADLQTMAFDVVVDRQAPVITTATYDEANKVFTPRPAQDQGPAGIFRGQVFYLAKDDKGSSLLVETNEEGKSSIKDNKVFVAKNMDGSFTLPLDLAELSQFYYVVEDYAGNQVHAKVEDLISIGNDLGLVTVKLLEQETEKPVISAFSYSVKDKDGKLVTELPRFGEDKSTLKLPFGTYTMELFLYDSERSAVAGSTVETVTIDEENSKKEVAFYVTAKKKADLVVAVDRLLPAGTHIELQTADGTVVRLPASTYARSSFGRYVPVGDYRVVATLPTGYEFVEDLSLTVHAGQRNRKALTLLDKTGLMALLADLAGVEEKPSYYNAAEAAQKVYQQALLAGQELLASKQSQQAIDAGIRQLQEAKTQLTGQETDRRALETEFLLSEGIRQSVLYQQAGTIKQAAYDAALRMAELLLKLSGKEASQVAVDTALANLLAKKGELDGQETDTSLLVSLTKAAKELQTSDFRYLNASSTSRSGLDLALLLADYVLFQSKPQLDEVTQAVLSLTDAVRQLDGQLPKEQEKRPTPLFTQPKPSQQPEVIVDREPIQVAAGQPKEEETRPIQVAASQPTQKDVSLKAATSPSLAAQPTERTLPRTGQDSQLEIALLGSLLAASTVYGLKKKED